MIGCPPTRIRRLWAGLWALLVLAMAQPTPALAAQPLGAAGPDAGPPLRGVAILPFKNNLVKVTDLFAPEKPAPASTDAEAIEAELLRLLSRTPMMRVMAAGDVRQTLADDHSATAQAQAAQQLYRIGLELYLSLAAARAVDKLRQATALYREGLQDLVDPRPYADAQFMLGVALVDSGQAAQGHIALKDGFALQPDRHFRPNFFPPSVAAALAAALTDHLTTADTLRPYGDHQRMYQVARRLDVRWLILGSLRHGNSGVELSVAVYSADRRLLEAELQVPLSQALEKLEPFLSRWLSCAPIEEERPVVRSRDRWRLDTSAAYAPFLRQPTRRAFQSLGFSTGLAHEFRPNLEWFGRLALHTSLSDQYRDLLRSFNSARAVAGVGATVQSGPVRVFAQLGLDAHLLGSFAASIDPDCKLFGTGHRLCDPASVLDLDQQVLVGVNAAVGTQVHLGRDFMLSLRVSLSNYFLPLDSTDRLNLPLATEFGLGYRL